MMDKMTEQDKRLAACTALGIGKDVANRWLQTEVKRERADDDGVPRFDVEGPIIGSSAQMYIDDLVGYTTPKMLRDFLAEHRGEDIEININSPGGVIFDSNAMVSDLLRHKGQINVVVSGLCASAATDFLSIPDAKRVAMPGSVFMVHRGWTFAVGDKNDFMDVAARLEKEDDAYAERMSRNSGVEKDEMLSMMDKETWMDENEALVMGFVDEVFGAEDATEDADDVSEEVSEADDDPEAMQRGKLAVDSRLAILL